MMKALKLKKLLTFASISLISTMMIMACGGGDQTSRTNNEPIHITAENWSKNTKSSSKSLRTTSITANIVKESLNKQFTVVRINAQGVSKNGHYQVHLDIDNNPNTGYRFTDAWSKETGIDFIIEDGVLFESTSNNNDWDWVERGTIRENFNSKGVNFVFPVARLTNNTAKKEICNTFNVGLLSLDNNWKIKQFYPNANVLLKQTTPYCQSPQNSVPVITLKGANPMVVVINSKFVDSGATAFDKEDGDITSQIKKIQMVYNPPGVYIDTSKLGTQTITYHVTDTGGHAGYAYRMVHVVNKTSNISIDGKIDDWALIDNFIDSNNTKIKVTNDENNVYVMINSSDLKSSDNWQMFFNSIGDTASNVSGYTAIGGADYLIENGSFAKFIGQNSSQWAWDFNISQPVMAQSGDIIEIMIPKSTLNSDPRSAGVRLGFTSLDSHWSDNYSIGNQYYSYINAYIPFENSVDISSIVEVNGAWYGIDSSKTKILKDDGAKVITTLYTSPHEITAGLNTSLENRLVFVDTKSKTDRNIRKELRVINTKTLQNTIIISDYKISIENGDMQNFIIIKQYGRSGRYTPENFGKIDSKEQYFGLGHNSNGSNHFKQYFVIESIDHSKNELLIQNKTVRSPMGGKNTTEVTLHKVTGTTGVGLEDR